MVFCVNRLRCETAVEAVTKHLSSLNVTVSSCYIVQAGGSSSTSTSSNTENESTNHKSKYITMRLCISYEDTKKILAAEVWPVSVTVRPWTFKSEQVRYQSVVGSKSLSVAYVFFHPHGMRTCMSCYRRRSDTDTSINYGRTCKNHLIVLFLHLVQLGQASVSGRTRDLTRDNKQVRSELDWL